MSTQTSGRVRFDALGIATTDLTASLAFYRRLGLEFPEAAEQAPHVEAVLPGGIRLMWDAVPKEQATPGGGGPQLAFRCASPAGVDALYAELTGPATRAPPRPGTPSGGSGTRWSPTRTATGWTSSRRWTPPPAPAADLSRRAGRRGSARSARAPRG
ncbi:hypothetical protein SDIAM103S_04928 [Streptomyces diastaticus subsp. diastaticus]